MLLPILEHIAIVASGASVVLAIFLIITYSKIATIKSPSRFLQAILLVCAMAVVSNSAVNALCWF